MKLIILQILIVFLSIGTTYGQSKYIEKANKAFVKGDKKKSEQILLKGLKKFPSDTTVMINLGYLYTNTKEYTKAKKYFNKVIEVDESCMNCWFQIGIVTYREGKNEESFNHYEKCLELKPDNIKAQVFALYSLSHFISKTNDQEILSRYDELLESAYENFEQMDKESREVYYTILVRKTSELNNELEMDYTDHLHNFNTYYHLDLTHLQELKSYIDKLLNLNFPTGVKGKVIPYKNMRPFRYMIDKMEFLAKSERKVSIKGGDDEGQMSVIVSVYRKLFFLEGQRGYKNGPLDSLGKVAAKIHPSIVIKYKTIYLNGNLPYSQLSQQLNKIVDLEEYKRVDIVFGFVNELRHFFYGKNDNDYQPNVIGVSEDNYFRLKKNEINNNQKLNEIIKNKALDIGMFCSFKHISIHFTPSDFKLVDEIDIKNKKSYGNAPGKSTVYSAKTFIFKPSNKVTYAQLEKGRKVYEEIFNTNLVFADKIYCSGKMEANVPFNKFEEQPQNLHINVILKSEKISFMSELLSSVNILGSSDGEYSSDPSVSSNTTKCDYSFVMTGDFENTGNEKSKIFKVKCNGKIVTYGGSLDVLVYKRKEYHPLYGQKGFYKQIDLGTDKYLGGTEDELIKNICECK